MTNRQKIMSQCLYDVLCRMNDGLAKSYPLEKPCIMDGFYGNGNIVAVRHRKFKGDCKKCIAEWLNEESEG